MKRTYYEDYIVGDEFETPARIVTEEDVRRFADLTGDRHRLHLDPEFGRTSIFGERISHGLLGMALVNGLAFSGATDSDYILAFLGVTWKFVAPIRFGDSVRAIIQVASRRPTRKADQGIVVEAIRLVNQRDELVQEGEFTFLVKRRGELNA
jgi:acyl dehydratase